MPVSAPPKKKAATAPIEPAATIRDKKIDEIINRGSSTVGKAAPAVTDEVKNFNIKLLSSQLSEIDGLRAYRPRKPTSPKLGISLQDWILEAIEEKIKREKDRYEKIKK